jgi:hypothetical protein
LFASLTKSEVVALYPVVRFAGEILTEQWQLEDHQTGARLGPQAVEDALDVLLVPRERGLLG